MCVGEYVCFCRVCMYVDWIVYEYVYEEVSGGVYGDVGVYGVGRLSLCASASVCGVCGPSVLCVRVW